MSKILSFIKRRDSGINPNDTLLLYYVSHNRFQSSTDVGTIQHQTVDLLVLQPSVR